jgi:hypothetical protein
LAEQLFPAQRNEVAAFGSNQSACSESNDNPSALVHPFSPEFKKTFSGEKISMRVKGICCLAHIFSSGYARSSYRVPEYRTATFQLLARAVA